MDSAPGFAPVPTFITDPMIAIHDKPGSFSDRWIEYCRENGIDYRIVNCFSTDIMTQLRGCSALMWEWENLAQADVLAGERVTRSAEAMGLRVFPDSATCWHYDDKVAQKYLLEAVGAEMVPSYAFYSLESALEWVERTDFPKVFKLARGSGSLNVFLVKTRDDARKTCRQAFGAGFKPIAGLAGDFSTRMRKHRRKGDLIPLLKRLPKTLATVVRYNRTIAREKGYAYFQDFIPNNTTDTRVTIIGDRAFAFTRGVRPNDFRASGSGDISYDMSKIEPRCVQIAFETVRRLRTQSLAFDFVKMPSGQPLIVEISYCYLADAVHACPGHWDSRLNWHEGLMWPQDAILIDLLDDLKSRANTPAS